MIKARPVAGDPWLGAAFVDGRRRRSSIRRSSRPRAIDDVRRTKVRLEEYIRQRGKELTEVKRGRGGIRDVEFAVQLLQIVHGRRDPLLRDAEHAAARSRTLAEEGYVGAGRRRGARRRLPVPAAAGAPAADRARPADARPAGRPARAHHARALARPGRRRRARRHEYEATTGHGPRDPRAALLPAVAGGLRRAGARRRPAWIAPRPRSCSAGSGSREPRTLVRGAAAGSSIPATRIGKVLAHVFPVMAPALALAADPDAALVRLERVADAVGDDRDGPADALATDPGRGAPPRARRRRQLVRHRPAGGRSRRGCTALADALLGAETDAAGELVAAVARYARPRAPAARDRRRARRRRGPRDPRRRGGRRARPAVRRDRDGQARRARAERGERPRPAVRLRGRGRRRPAAGRSPSPSA